MTVPSGDAWQEGMPTVYHKDNSMLVVSKESNQYVDIQNKNLRIQYFQTRNRTSKEQGRYYTSRADPLNKPSSSITAIEAFVNLLAFPIPFDTGYDPIEAQHKRDCSLLNTTFNLYQRYDIVY